MEIKKFQFKLSETALIFVVPVFFYSILYCLEVAYADYFHIPFGIVTIKITDYIGYSILISLALLFAFAAVYISAFSYDILYSEGIIKNRFVKILISSIFRITPFGFVLKIQYDNFNSYETLVYYALIYMILTGMIILTDVIFMNLPEKGNTTMFHSIFRLENRNKYFTGTLIFVYILFTSMFFYSFEYWWASKKNEFYVYDKNNIIIAIYDNNVIVKTKEDFLTQKKTIKIVPLSSIDDKTLTWEVIEK